MDSPAAGKRLSVDVPHLVRVVREVDEIRVSGRTNVQDLAWAVTKRMDAAGGVRVCLTAIGTQAVNQAVKAIAIANSRTAAHGVVCTALPAMEDVEIDVGESETIERTVIKLILVPYTW